MPHLYRRNVPHHKALHRKFRDIAGFLDECSKIHQHNDAAEEAMAWVFQRFGQHKAAGDEKYTLRQEIRKETTGKGKSSPE
jgi:hypothetical protein